MLAHQARQFAIRPAQSAATATIVLGRAFSVSAHSLQDDSRPRRPSQINLLNFIPKKEETDTSLPSDAQGPARSPSINDETFFTRTFARPKTSHSADGAGDSMQSKAAKKNLLAQILTNLPEGSRGGFPNYHSRDDPSDRNTNLLAKSVMQSLREDPEFDLRLNASTGRTVEVNNKFGLDAVRAVRMLEIACAKNKVRAQQRDQRFHVRRSQKKKDLRMKRWRALFKKSFKQTLSRCAKMKSQGW
ncbi:Ribosomal protein S21 [Ascosphaera apis ARSEF 7405]|uniref:Ribosomal protein S21 n=1 Tax=Ascosphaera apis ARSEF 7405 TaxID=392613 RepID=A0A167WUI1_9EURO|nr:Ribosomal protein S21 [Ascosphaera apis ARSEF 7405]